MDLKDSRPRFSTHIGPPFLFKNDGFDGLYGDGEAGLFVTKM